MVSVSESPSVLVGLNQALQKTSADSAGSMWQVAGLIHAPQNPGRERSNITQVLFPINATVATGDRVPMKVETVIVSVASMLFERTGIRTSGAAARANGDRSCFGVGADTREVKAQR